MGFGPYSKYYNIAFINGQSVKVHVFLQPTLVVATNDINL
ncbi:hypothetical protein Lser_V15G28258 [Lactuca serriola]